MGSTRSISQSGTDSIFYDQHATFLTVPNIFSGLYSRYSAILSVSSSRCARGTAVLTCVFTLEYPVLSILAVLWIVSSPVVFWSPRSIAEMSSISHEGIPMARELKTGDQASSTEMMLI